MDTDRTSDEKKGKAHDENEYRMTELNSKIFCHS